MAAAVQSLRLSLRATGKRAVAPTRACPRQLCTFRYFSSSPVQRLPATKKDDAERSDEENPDERDLLDDVEYDPESVKEYLQANATQIRQTAKDLDSLLHPFATKFRGFWESEEDDPDLRGDKSTEMTDEFDEDDIMSIAHGKLEEHREYREYARIAAWQMPLLSKLVTPFEPPTAQQPLRFRYTSYMGEFHPAEKKVVVEFSPRDLPLDEAQRKKLRKLLGPRLNPETDIAKMSCEQFEHPAQNKRYLGDLVNKLVAQAKDSSDMFEDIPLDTRHHISRVKAKFPKEWHLTEARLKEIEDARQKALLLDQTKEAEGLLVDGNEKIQNAFTHAGALLERGKRVPIPVRALR
ncbi:mitochondrial ribosomal subunit protein-domain-containing protein [Xylariaceae sp. FL0594]|nr:mitochondrial ribosomal subunit protein-domain-containing protein [Xylariaceae sp. FL0594]